MIYTDPTDAAPAFARQIAEAHRILLLTHINPDGDAIGSLLGACHALRAIGKEPIPVASSALPSYGEALPGVEQVTIYQAGGALPDCDLIWMLDTASLERVGQIYRDHGPAMAARPLMIVDHHVTNDGAGTLNLIQPQAASCADLLFRLLRAMELPISPEAATCMLLGTTTDTQSFQTSATLAQTLRTAAEMIDAGADQRLVVSAIYFSVPETTARMVGLALSQLQREGGLLWVKVSREMMRASGAADEATDEAMKQIQRVAGMRAAVLFKERANGKVKISMRSVPGINVAEVARTWGGGGHTQAAGADLPMGLDEAEAAVLPLLRAAIGG
ncbi:bifunctional oligoribonuclease/PAP phosphatase NrnA [Oscillochloris sp. ZM17-4]|uniref:DHH family phosphoesterase n=1 Tax=Oscillochloris sp. ZM17-4 TaxID=2866714 RepID=UPI001C739A98|nr:bifunctional oligoribonuclease/PAP phosphatase NrnA [Oscillochloris sp. ZM17-4]MBX0326205.1 bifunctional oligoribonuclease/PAP phosphatase NrnA [Oscillochloris sp. ZM17-4]